jgi:hypothetical protein
MIIGNRADICDASAVANSLASDNTNIYYVTSQSSFKRVNQETGTITLNNIASSINCYGVALISAASTVQVFSSANVYFTDVTTGAFSVITSGAASVVKVGVGYQQLAANPSTKIAVATRTTNNTVTLIDGNTFTVSALSVSMGGAQATCVAAKTGTSNFFAATSATSTLTIYEFDTSGTVIKSFSPAITRVGGALSTYEISAMTYYDNYLLIATTSGTLQLYDWSQSTPVLLDTLQYNNWNNTYAPCLSNNVSGTCYFVSSCQTGSNYGAINEICFDRGRLFPASVWTGMNTTAVGSALTLSPSSQILGMGTGNSSSLPAMKIYSVTPVDKVNVQTRLQDPPTVDITGRVIRIRDAGVGRSFVELDTTVTAGVNELPANNGSNYIELALITSPNKWDVREFKA